MAPLPAPILPRVGALLRLLGSDADGEALGAARALQRTLDGVGLDLHALADALEHPPAPVVSPRPRRAHKSKRDGDCVEISLGRAHEIAEALRRALDGSSLTSWEIGFAESVVGTLRGSRPRLSDRQMDIVERLLGKAGRAGA